MEENKERKKDNMTKEKLEKEKSQKISEIHCANRDGDLHYISCPKCDCVDLRKFSLYMCKTCGDHFDVYHEDGHRKIILRDYPTQTDKRLEIGSFTKSDDYFQGFFKLTPRVLQYNLPWVVKKILYRDLRKDGFDGHGHKKYRRYAIIPLD